MVIVNDVFDNLRELAPTELQLSYDNSGFLIGHADAKLSRVILSLDVTDEVIDEAIETGSELIVSHHPVIWDAMKSVTDGDIGAKKLLRLIENRIAVISMHTNLDIAPGGVNDVLLSLFEAENEGFFEEDKCGRRGRLSKPVTMQEFLPYCKDRLCSSGLRYYDAGRPVEHIAVLGGSGGENIRDAFIAGCDTYISSDFKYHELLLARELGINIVDGDHFCTEAPVMHMLAERLSEAFPGVVFTVSKRHSQTAAFYV